MELYFQQLCLIMSDIGALTFSEFRSSVIGGLCTQRIQIESPFSNLTHTLILGLELLSGLVLHLDPFLHPQVVRGPLRVAA